MPRRGQTPTPLYPTPKTPGFYGGMWWTQADIDWFNRVSASVNRGLRPRRRVKDTPDPLHIKQVRMSQP